MQKRTESRLARLALVVRSQRRRDVPPPDDNVALRIVNDALIARNIQLREELSRQHVVLDALQAFVVEVSRALSSTRETLIPAPQRDAIHAQLATLTARQAEVLRFVVAGYPSKRIALELRISQRTVENHRASIMTKTGATSVPALTQIAMQVGIGRAMVAGQGTARVATHLPITEFQPD
jgi:DNA-binding CsgD family transcriptional regulator